MSGLTLDAGALIAVERGDRRIRALLAELANRGDEVAVPAGVVAQVWRGGARQSRVARLLAAPEVHVVALDDTAARAAGVLCGRSRTADVVDASVIVCARERGDMVVTGDPGDLRRLDPGWR